MPIIGWYSGSQVVSYFEAFDHWIAFALLALVGGHMIFSGGESRSLKAVDPSRGMTLIILSIATSIDALAVGLSLSLIRVDIAVPAIVIGLGISLYPTWDWIDFLKIKKSAILKIRMRTVFSIYAIFIISAVVVYAWRFVKIVRHGVPEDTLESKPKGDVS